MATAPLQLKISASALSHHPGLDMIADSVSTKSVMMCYARGKVV